MSQQFATLFRAWLQREGITRSQAIARLGTASQSPYGYASGETLPRRRLIPDIAQRMGVDVEHVRTAVEADLAARRAAAPGSAASAPTSDHASVPSSAPPGAGW